ncbi:MAG: hypothetical protein JXR25_03275 [Pontiellaceae bacterium]|nr:hypothetical protein [Pontiellaceae bacterium]MBN2783825.1 hypothetical protein [Pontiellaceae bacterium]
MSRRWFFLLVLSVLLTVSCSKRDDADSSADKWEDIQPIADKSDSAEESGANIPAESDASDSSGADDFESEFNPFYRRLQAMKNPTRQNGQTLLTSDHLVLDYQARSVRMDQNVVVTDDRGELRTEHLEGRLSATNQVDRVTAGGGVSIVAGPYSATGEKAAYNYLDGTIRLDGQATVHEGENRFSGEHITLWVTGNRRMLCEPNAVLYFSGTTKVSEAEVPEDLGITEIRASRVFYDEAKHRVDLVGNVRLRNDRVAMNCRTVYMLLKDNNEIDWIEAVGGVIIQSEGTKALAERAMYDAKKGSFTLEGDPVIMQEKNVLAGDRIIYWLETQAVLCEPNGRVLLYLDDETHSKLLKDLND